MKEFAPFLTAPRAYARISRRRFAKRKSLTKILGINLTIILGIKIIKREITASVNHLGFWRTASIFLALPLTSKLDALCGGNANLFPWLCLRKLGRVGPDGQPKQKRDNPCGYLSFVGGASSTKVEPLLILAIRYKF